MAQKRQIISSIYPKKLTFDGFQYRTPRMNEAVRLIYTLDKGFGEMKNRKNNEFSCLFGGVVPMGLTKDMFGAAFEYYDNYLVGCLVGHYPFSSIINSKYL